jgi:hypothetical protein
MANPTAPTAATITAEAFYKVGMANPSTAKITRATDYFLEEVKHDMWTRRHANGEPVRYKTLQNVSVDITTVGINRMALPTDFDQPISISLLTGEHTGTVKAGGGTSAISLATDEDASEAQVVGHYILLTGGGGENQLRQVWAYSTTLTFAYVSPDFDTAPDTTTTYRIIDNERELDPESIEEIGIIGDSWATGKPSAYAYFNEGVNRYILFDKPPDVSTYGIIFRYYSNIHLIDTGEGSTIMTAIYRDWRNALVYGVATKIAEDEDDTKYSALLGVYEREVADIIGKELPYYNQFEGFTL